MPNRGAPQIAPYRASLDLVLDARGVIDQLAAAEVADEQKRHQAALDRIKRRYAEDILDESEQHRDYLKRIEQTRSRIADYERQMAAQLTVVGWPSQATRELKATAYPEAGV